MTKIDTLKPTEPSTVDLETMNGSQRNGRVAVTSEMGVVLPYKLAKVETIESIATLKEFLAKPGSHGAQAALQGAPKEASGTFVPRSEIDLKVKGYLQQALKAVKGSLSFKRGNASLRRRGVYTFLYGGRVNVDTFYDYKDEETC
ncbi:hypothetical protein DXG01_001258 [Tephrocybe rancida]|nr:hypothetical protein DXG01_001258 [Tephrocybe rancida]